MVDGRSNNDIVGNAWALVNDSNLLVDARENGWQSDPPDEAPHHP
jgi:hypothetical protein